MTHSPASASGDQPPAGPGLTWPGNGQARRRSPSELSDQELCGIMRAARRLESWAAGVRLTTVNELDARRAGKNGRPGEHVAEEAAAVFVLTPRSADELIGLTRNLAVLPQTRALLGAGILDPDRAKVIADALAVLDRRGHRLGLRRHCHVSAKPYPA